MTKELPKAYGPKDSEEKIYKLWEESGFFNPDNLPDGDPFTIIMPPPNVTGILSIGHALMLTLQDILVRFKRMQGRKALWLPGTDHAAIATQAKVETDLYKKEGKTRHDFSREEFLALVEKFALDSHDTIVNQTKKMGASADWSREAYTLDEQRTLAVRTAFKQMYEAGIIYRGNRIINWDPKLQTTVSDDEIEWKEEKSPFYYLKYGPFTIATARPETKFGDKYIVVHPDDARYEQFKHGQKLDIEWINGRITATVIKDDSIDMEFGTGAMTITPWHDPADFAIAQKHGLDFEQIIDFKGLLLPIAEEFAGEHIKKARPKIVAKLQGKGLIEKIDETYVHRIATNSRGGGIIEPQIKKQWFIKVEKEFKMPHSEIDGIKSGQEATLKQLMKHVVESGQIKIIPEYFNKTYYHWIDNLRDWNISRQIWYGHRIPVWYCNAEKAETARMDFAGIVAEQISKGKTRTYRLKDLGFKLGDKFLFENTQTKTVFGIGTITAIDKKKIKDIPLDDKPHYATYKSLAELLAAFQRHQPANRVITGENEAYIYDYTFEPLTKENSADGCGQMIVSADEPAQCPVCGNKKLSQDTDTLDTWFSSGLWTFSTLGWPNETPDLKTFHPTNVLETGYDILFFWVARMILMTTYLLGEVPFRTVYLHGLIRAPDRQKMSKSKGNIVDPLDVIEKYGTDALRFALIFNTAAGTDQIYAEDKVKGMKHFANKLWNIARFIQMNLENSKSKNLNPKPKTEVDEKVLAALDETKKSVTENLEQYKFHEAAQSIYHFTWREFADIYIEASKPQLQDEELKQNTQDILQHCLENILKMLHPFMPFVTEEIWQQMDKHLPAQTGKLLMVEQWPK